MEGFGEMRGGTAPLLVSPAERALRARQEASGEGNNPLLVPKVGLLETPLLLHAPAKSIKHGKASIAASSFYMNVTAFVATLC